MKRVVDMTEGNPVKHILVFAFPLIITNIGQQLYMIADAAIVGRGVGVQALASVGATDWCYWLILWTITGLTQGFATFIARYFGDKKYGVMNNAIAVSIILCGVMGVIFTVAGFIAARPLLELLNTPADILEGAVIYLKTMISGTIVVIAYNMSAAILRAFGDGKTPLIAMVIAAFMNIGLDCLFVFGLNMEIFGAALASVMSQFVSFVYCVSNIRKIPYINLGKDAWVSGSALMKKMVLFGVPVAMQYIVIAIGGIILQSSVNLQGSVFIAGYTATNKVYGLLESGAISIGLACSTFTAQNYGAHLYDRVKNGIRDSVVMVTFLAVIVTSVTLTFRRDLLQLFLDKQAANGPAALNIASDYLEIMASFIVILFFVHIFRSSLEAMGIAKWSIISGCVEFCARSMMAKTAIAYLGKTALFLSEPVAWTGAAFSVILPYLYYRSRLLKQKITYYKCFE